MVTQDVRVTALTYSRTKDDPSHGTEDNPLDLQSKAEGKEEMED